MNEDDSVKTADFVNETDFMNFDEGENMNDQVRTEDIYQKK